MKTFVSMVVFLALNLQLSPQTAEQQKHPKYAEMMKHHNAYNEASKKGEHAVAMSEAEKAAILGIEVVGPEDVVMATLYAAYAGTLYLTHQYEKSILYYEKALAIGAKTLGENHANMAVWHTNCGTTYFSTGAFDQAASHFTKALAARQKILGPDHPDLSNNYNNVGRAYKEGGYYDKAIPYFEKALAIDIKSLGPEHPEVAYYYSNLGTTYDSKGIYEKAVEYNTLAVAIALKAPAGEHPALAVFYGNLGAAYRDRDYDKAISNYDKALAIDIRKLGPDHPDVAVDYNCLAGIYDSKGEYDKAISYYQKALAIGRKALNPQDMRMGTWYNNLALTYNTKGEYDKAMHNAETALAISLKALGPKHPNVATRFSTLGAVHLSQGSYDKALSCFEKALEIDLKILGPEHPDVANQYSTLGIAYDSKGDYDKAILHYEKARAISLKALGPDHPVLATRDGNLAMAYWQKGEYDAAIDAHQKALAIRLKTLGGNHPDVATNYSALANTFQAKNEYAKAAEYSEKAVLIGELSLGHDNPVLAVWYNNLGVSLEAKGDYAMALRFYKKALAIRLKSVDRDGVLNSFSTFAKYYERRAQPKQASENYENATAKILEYRLEINEKSKFSARYAYIFSKHLALALAEKDWATAFRVHSLRSGLSIAEGLGLAEALAQGGVPVSDRKRLNNLTQSLESLRSQRDAAIAKNSAKKADELFDQIRQTENEKDKLDAELIKTYSKYAEIRKPEPPTPANLQKSLKPNELLVSYAVLDDQLVTFIVSKEKGLEVVTTPVEKDYKDKLKLKVQNLHTILRRGTNQPVVVIESALGERLEGNCVGEGISIACDNGLQSEGGEIFTVIRNTRGVAQGNIDSGKSAGLKKVSLGKIKGTIKGEEIKARLNSLRAELNNTLLEPVLKRYGSEKKRLIIVPDSALYYVPFGWLQNDLRKSDVKLVHSPTVFYKLRNKPKSKYEYPLLAMGNAIYGEGHADAASGQRGQRRALSKQAEEQVQSLRNANPSDGEIAELQWNNLAGTGAEVKAIAKLVYPDDEGKAHTLTGMSANLDKLLSMKKSGELKKYRVLHFATHGLFVDENPALNALVLTLKTSAEKYRNEAYQAYVKSAGKALQHDGYLRTGTIRGLDLKAELVVMSACETSLGNEMGGEGMVGLPQAFLIGGARNVIASLWSVDDQSTAELMALMYKHYITDKMPVEKALKKAQQELSKQKKFKDPTFWAAFVVYGD